MNNNKTKNKITKKNVVSSIIIVALVILMLFSMFIFTSVKASAAVVRTPVYTTYGSYSYDGKTYSGYPSSSFKVTLNGALTEGVGTLYNNDVINWTWYTFKVVDTEIYEHVSVKLYRNNSLYHSQSLSDDGNITLFDKSLSDGEYRLEYSCKVGNFFVNTLYTYTYCFRVDSTAPTVSLKAGGSTINGGTYTNKQVVYSATDASTVKIYVKSPSASSYGVSYSSSYTVAATSANNGWWYVYASDSVGNSTSAKSFYMDVTAPSGTVYGGTTSKSSGGSTNASYVKYVASDAHSGVANCYVRKPGSTSYVSYTSGSQLTTEGTYYFYCVDKAGNQSSTSTITLDKSLPWGTLYGGATIKSSGSYTNADYVKYTASDSWSGVKTVYVKMPNTSLYTTYSSGTQLATEGTYSFYCVDNAGNQSSIVTITLDKTKPTGRITGDANNISQYTKASYIKFIASDSNSGVANCYVKKPNSSSYVAYTSGTELTAEGSYTFYCTDKAGNASAYYSVIVDRQVPVGTVYGGEAIKSNGVYTNASYVKYTANDGVSGIKALYVKMPNSSTYSNYSSGTQLATEGTYYFYAVDNAGNESETISITLDKTKPTGIIYGGTKEFKSGAYTNASYVKFVPSDNFLLNSIYVKKPNATSYSSYTSGTQLTTEGTYTFYCTDKAGNTSEYYSVTVDRQAPSGQLYVDGKAVSNGTYTNGDYIKFVCSETCYIKEPGNTSFKAYTSGAELNKPGKYVFYGKDTSGNTSSEYILIIDRTIKQVTISSVTDGKTNGDVKISWTNGDANSYAPIKTVTVNGKAISNGATVYTIDTGSYIVKVVDAAGNEWQTQFSSTKKNVLTDTLAKEYFEVHDINEDIFSFTSYDSALEFAKAREMSKVKNAEWNNSTWDTGIPMDTIDAANAANGTYYIYYKSGNPEELVAYFTLDRLNQVIEEYAKVGIKDYFYWEKEPAQAGPNENLYSYSAGRSILAKSVELGENIGVTVDGETFVGSVYETEGKHVLVVSDSYGNSCEYNLTIIRTMPDLFYAIGEGTAVKAEFDRTYYFKDEITISITDALDEMAMFNVYDADGNLIGSFSADEVCKLSESGIYTAESVNHMGISEEFKIVISRNAPSVDLKADEEAKQLVITVTGSSDEESHLQTIEIQKSTDGGQTWNVLDTDDYGTAIELGTLVYKFRTTGMYKIVVTDEFRTGMDAISGQITYTQPAPTGDLVGVTDGGHTNKEVTFSWDDEAKVTVTKDGEVIEYNSGDKLTADGEYTIVFENFDGAKITYEFVIDTQPVAIAAKGHKANLPVNNPVTVIIAEEYATAVLIKDGVEVGAYVFGTAIADEGKYVIRVTDAAQNVSEIEFEIDKSVDFAININDGGLANSVTVIANEDVEIVLTKDGAAVEYEEGSEITEPGKYTLKIADALGNIEEINFTIVNALYRKFEEEIDVMPGFEKVLVNGEEVSIEKGTLILTASGAYDVTIVANGKEQNFMINVDATAPTLIITGVENGGVTNDAVILSDLSEEAILVLTRGEEVIEYSLGDEISKQGIYKVTVTDSMGNVSEYTFEIEKSVNGAVIALIVIVVIAVIGGVVVFILKKKKVF